MYGTVARLQLQPRMEAKLQELIAHQVGQGKIPGMVGEYVYRMDANPNEYYVCVAFESKEAYFANANSPEQHARYEQLRALLEADPEWHDGEIVSSFFFY